MYLRRAGEVRAAGRRCSRGHGVQASKLLHVFQILDRREAVAFEPERLHARIVLVQVCCSERSRYLVRTTVTSVWWNSPDGP